VLFRLDAEVQQINSASIRDGEKEWSCGALDLLWLKPVRSNAHDFNLETLIAARRR
jgi:hypothetical protein